MTTMVQSCDLVCCHISQRTHIHLEFLYVHIFHQWWNCNSLITAVGLNNYSDHMTVCCNVNGPSSLPLYHLNIVCVIDII